MSKNKKSIKRKRTMCAIGIMTMFLIVLIALISLVIKIIINNKEFYKIETRTENIEKYNKEKHDYDAIGWLRVQGTNIDYPVLSLDPFADNNQIDEKFTWIINDVDKIVNKIYILGHNVMNLSSQPKITDKNHINFEQLPSFLYYDFAEKNKYIQFTLNGKNYLYKIFSVSITNEFIPYSSANVEKTKLKEYIEKSKNRSYFDFDVDVNEDDNIITLATCTRFFGPTTNYTYLIDARMVRKDEKISNYNINKNDNYKEVEKILKGGDDDEKVKS